MALKTFICYIDPGTGSLVAQVAAAAAIGIIVSIKSFWMNIKLFFAKIFCKNQTLLEENNEDGNN